MLEKLLKRFITDDAKLILQAMELWAENNEVDSKTQPSRMLDDYVSVCGQVDRAVLNRARGRLALAREKTRRIKSSIEIAAQILLGAKFEEHVTSNTSSATAAQGMSQGLMNANMANQQAYNQRASMNMARQMNHQGLGQFGAQIVDPRALYGAQ